MASRSLLVTGVTMIAGYDHGQLLQPPSSDGVLMIVMGVLLGDLLGEQLLVPRLHCLKHDITQDTSSLGQIMAWSASYGAGL